MAFNHQKYKAWHPIDKADRQWPTKRIEKAPIWASVDLRDGNQALVKPMNLEQKMEMFELLVDMGFKEIEIGFPSAAQIEFDFTRKLIEENRIPEDVTIQVLVQAREHLIERTYEALEGVHQAIVHVYNSTSIVQRERVFEKSQEEIKDIAVNGAKLVQEYAKKYPQTKWRFEYSPESFTGTEPEYALDVCNAVLDVWQPTAEAPAIINLPATIEMTMPNVFADMVEFVHERLHFRDGVHLSVHTHNDRGCAVAAGELAVLAGADRVEGTLFGNGERTGNMDILTMAMNLYMQGIDPEIDCSQRKRMERVYKYCTDLPIHPRHPWFGELVYTAFSGSHQDAIRKSMSKQGEDEHWQVAYLPIDPADVEREYEAVIRVNSQSGKGGIAWTLEEQAEVYLPTAYHPHLAKVVQPVAEAQGGVLSVQEILQVLEDHFVNQTQHLCLTGYSVSADGDRDVLMLKLNDGKHIEGIGSGPIAAASNALSQWLGTTISVEDYREHALTQGSESEAMAHMVVKFGDRIVVGSGKHRDILRSALNALMSAVNRAIAEGVVDDVRQA
ncbi:2-isopropylmalate synthase [Salinibius halmophilus]|uniref:2-isopropylmalate synthase n=1 Tax=Salinibius halmophilus TaxID=1853216 RepID=UPI000E6614D6|nr:2-isopropylmalate synthase [Salinibius halmophilus]